MDMLTKLKMLSNQLEDPEFLEQFSKDFDIFLSERNEINSMELTFSDVKLDFLRDNYETESSNGNFTSSPLTSNEFYVSNVAMAA